MGFFYEIKGGNLWKEILVVNSVILRYDVNKICYLLMW